VKQRLNKISSFLEEKRLDAFLVTSDINIGYLSGLEQGDAILLIAPGKTNLIITDPRFIQEASSLKEFKAQITSQRIPLVLSRKFRELALKKIAFEAKNLTYSQYTLLKEACDDVKFVPTTDIIEGMRSIKDTSEIKKIRETIEIGICAFEALREELKPGMTERCIADRLEVLIREKGGLKSAFDTITASGINTSRPHAHPTNRVWKPQDLLLIDWGVHYNGYNCDLTRVLFSDRITNNKKRIYKILLEAQEKAISAIKPGVKAKEISNLAGNYLKKYKLDKFFLHSLGHGVGREVHESPWISPKSETELQENMVFTLEPAVYFSGSWGMRIEDMVMVTKSGHKVISKRLKQEYFYA